MTAYPHRYGDTDRARQHYATACVASAAVLRSEGFPEQAADLGRHPFGQLGDRRFLDEHHLGESTQPRERSDSLAVGSDEDRLGTDSSLVAARAER